MLLEQQGYRLDCCQTVAQQKMELSKNDKLSQIRSSHPGILNRNAICISNTNSKGLISSDSFETPRKGYFCGRSRIHGDIIALEH